MDGGTAWDAYVERKPGATLHHLFGWKMVVERAYGLRAPFLAARDTPGGCIRGVLPLIVVPRPFTSYLTTGPFGAYGPLLADEERYARALIASAAKRVDAGEVRYLHLKLLGEAPAGLGLERQDIWVTAKLDLGTAEEALWQRLPRKLRWAVRHAARSGLDRGSGIGELDAFYEVLCENMHRKGAPIYGRSFFRSILRAFAAQADIITLRHRGRVVSGALVATFNGTMYVPFASSRVDYFKLGVNQLLYWEVLRRAYETACRTLDFGSSIRDSTVLDFKLRWRPRLEPIASYVYARPGARPKLDPRESMIAAAVSEVWARLPSSLTRAFGPALCRWIV
jgi:FemAB-related protein (PEP-CTERM system-associated)